MQTSACNGRGREPRVNKLHARKGAADARQQIKISVEFFWFEPLQANKKIIEIVKGMSKGGTAVWAHIQSLCSERTALLENGIFENGLFSDSQQVVPLEDWRLRSVRVRHDPSQFRKVCFQSGKNWFNISCNVSKWVDYLWKTSLEATVIA